MSSSTRSSNKDEKDDHDHHDHDQNDDNNNNDDNDDDDNDDDHDNDEETGNNKGDNNTNGRRKRRKKKKTSTNNALSKLKMLSISKKAAEIFQQQQEQNTFNNIDYPKLECTFRITITGFIGIGLCLWSYRIPNLIPSNMSYIIGMLTVVLSYSIPHLLCSILLIFPTLIFTFVIGFVGTTIVLGGVLISDGDGMLCLFYALYCLLMSFLYFGPNQIKTKGNVPGFVALVGMLTISFKPLIVVKDDPAALKELWTTSGITNPVAVYQNLLIIVGWSMLIVTIVIIFIPPIRTARSIIITKLIPGALIKSVQLIEETCTSSSSSSSGTNNNDGEEINSGGGENNNNEEEDNDEQQQHKQKELISKGKDTLAHLQSILEGGNVASLTMFEPRLCKPQPVHLTLKELVEITDDIVLVAFEIILLSENEKKKLDDLQNNNNKFIILQKFLHVIKSCAIAISENNNSYNSSTTDDNNDLLHELLTELEGDELQHIIIVRPGIDLLKSTIKWLDVYNNNNNNSSEHHRDQHDDDKPSTTSFIIIIKNFMKVLFISLFGPVIPTMKRLLEVIFVLPFKVITIWDTWTVLYCIKIMSGFVILFVMSIYWDAFGSFGISTDIEHHGRVGGIFSGWHIASFAFALLPTREGTIKKGTQRIVGTAVGGFLAWAGLIICSGFTTDDTNEEVNNISPGGLLAYITIICFIVAYWTYPAGIEAYFGSSKDHGFVGVYLLVTLLLITLETYLGMGNRDDLTVNRIVATITGALMAMIVSVIPPSVSGGDPYHAKKALRLQKEAFKSFITAVLANDEGATKNHESTMNSGDNKDPEGEIEVQYKEQQQDDEEEGDINNKRKDSNYGHYDEAIELIDEAKEKRNLATTLCKNANMFHVLPIFNVNPLLPIEIDHLGLDEMLIRRTIEYTATKQQQEDEEDTSGGGKKPETGLGGGSMRSMDEASKLRFQTVLDPLRSSSDDNENEDDNDEMKEEEGPTTITTEGDGISLMDWLHSNGHDDAGVPTSEWEIISKAAILVQRRLHEREMSLNSI